jgi:hypothetical protein
MSNLSVPFQDSLLFSQEQKQNFVATTTAIMIKTIVRAPTTFQMLYIVMFFMPTLRVITAGCPRSIQAVLGLVVVVRFPSPGI